MCAKIDVSTTSFFGPSKLTFAPTRWEITEHHNAQCHFGQSEDWIFCVSLATCTCIGWHNILSGFCRSIKLRLIVLSICHLQRTIVLILCFVVLEAQTISHRFSHCCGKSITLSANSCTATRSSNLTGIWPLFIMSIHN